MTQRELRHRRAGKPVTNGTAARLTWFSQPVAPLLDFGFNGHLENPRAKVCVVTGYTSDPTWQSIGSITAASMRAYCQRHGYAFRLHTTDFEPDIPASWSKVTFLREALEQHEVAVWIDADAIVTNPDIGIDSFVPAEALALCSDPRGVNCGVILVRRCTVASELLDKLWAERFSGNRLWEQDTMHRLLWRGELSGNLRICPPRTFNSRAPTNSFHADYAWYNWQPGDFIAHFYNTGGNNAWKLECIRKATAQALNRSRRWVHLASRPRSGTHFLRSLISSAEGCAAVGEVFAKNGCGQAGYWDKCTHPKSWLDDNVPPSAKIVAWALQSYGLEPEQLDLLRTLHDQVSTHAIVLYRRDMLAQYASFLLACESGRWSTKIGQPPSMGTLAIGPRQFARWCHHTRESLYRDLRTWRDKPLLIVNYEQATADPQATIRQLEAFLDTELHGSKADTDKVEKRGLSEFIENYGQLADMPCRWLDPPSLSAVDEFNEREIWK